jgi:tetratricopeptide (TPR) repeat protein
MSDSLRTDRSRALDAAADVDRDAKIEQLLLVGLDHYFAAQYDQAINVWTRALFLDRSHPRARAYIERARSALAERQRESEELLQNGVAAFKRGEGGEARRLLQAAIDAGAPTDEALAVLERLNRLEATVITGPPRTAREGAVIIPEQTIGRARYGRLLWLVPIALALVGAGVFALTTSDSSSLLPYLRLAGGSGTIAPAVGRRADLPLPRRGETALARARVLASGGHLADALAALDMVRLTDVQRAEADRLRSTIQGQLLAVTSMPENRSPERDNRDLRDR